MHTNKSHVDPVPFFILLNTGNSSIQLIHGDTCLFLSEDAPHYRRYIFLKIDIDPNFKNHSWCNLYWLGRRSVYSSSTLPQCINDWSLVQQVRPRTVNQCRNLPAHFVIFYVKIIKGNVHCCALRNRDQINTIHVVCIVVWVFRTFQRVVYPRTTCYKRKQNQRHQLILRMTVQSMYYFSYPKETCLVKLQAAALNKSTSHTRPTAQHGWPRRIKNWVRKDGERRERRRQGEEILTDNGKRPKTFGQENRLKIGGLIFMHDLERPLPIESCHHNCGA